MTRASELNAATSLMTDIHAHLRACEAARNMCTAATAIEFITECDEDGNKRVRK